MTEFEAMLRIKVKGNHIKIHFPSCTKVSLVSGIVSIQVREYTIPFVLKWITNIQTDNILICKILFGYKTF
jgi:hypothetical protein